MRRLLLALALVCLPVFATPAQAQPIAKWTLAIYLAGGTTPVVPPFDILFPNAACNQADPGGVTINPLKVVWNDPNVSGKVCIWVDPQTVGSPLAAVPIGTAVYEATLTSTSSAGTTPESARATFTKPGVILSAPTGLKLVR